MTDNIFRLVMPALKTEINNGTGDRNLILPLILLLAADSADMPLVFSLLYIIMQ